MLCCTANVRFNRSSTHTLLSVCHFRVVLLTLLLCSILPGGFFINFLGLMISSVLLCGPSDGNPAGRCVALADATEVHPVVSSTCPACVGVTYPACVCITRLKVAVL